MPWSKSHDLYFLSEFILRIFFRKKKEKEPRAWASLYSKALICHITERKSQTKAPGRIVLHEVPLHGSWAANVLRPLPFPFWIPADSVIRGQPSGSWVTVSRAEGKESGDAPQSRSELWAPPALTAASSALDKQESWARVFRFPVGKLCVRFVFLVLREHVLPLHVTPKHILRDRHQIYLLTIYHVVAYSWIWWMKQMMQSLGFHCNLSSLNHGFYLCLSRQRAG